jgi:hypothetical protein
MDPVAEIPTEEKNAASVRAHAALIATGGSIKIEDFSDLRLQCP